MNRFRVRVVLTLEESDSDMAEAEVEAQLSDLVSLSSTTISEFEIQGVTEVEYETEEDF